MSQYRLDINGIIGLSDYSSIHDYLGLIGVYDKFTISLEKLDSNNLDIICSMLKDNNFVVTERGENEGGRYYITAIRNK